MQGVAIPGQRDALRHAFLEAYPRYRTITATCAALGVSTPRFYELVELDPSFASDFERAKEAVGDEIEGEMLRRALAGESAMSDTLLIFATKRFRPEYRDSSTVNVKSVSVNVDLSDLPPSELHALLQLALSDTSAPALPQLPAPD